MALNSLTETSRIFVQALEELTLRRDLSLLTMLPYREALSGVSLLRRTKAWCCTCYEEWREAGQVIYEPLLWLLSVVTLCPRHALPLEVRCPNPNCARQQFPLTAQGQPGYCPWCRRWLGSKKTCNPLKLTDEEQAEQLQNGELVGALLAATSHASVRFSERSFCLGNLYMQRPDSRRESLSIGSPASGKKLDDPTMATWTKRSPTGDARESCCRSQYVLVRFTHGRGQVPCLSLQQWNKPEIFLQQDRENDGNQRYRGNSSEKP